MDNFKGIDGSAILILLFVLGCAWLLSRFGQWYIARPRNDNWVDIDPKVYRGHK